MFSEKQVLKGRTKISSLGFLANHSSTLSCFQKFVLTHNFLSFFKRPQVVFSWYFWIPVMCLHSGAILSFHSQLCSVYQQMIAIVLTDKFKLFCRYKCNSKLLMQDLISLKSTKAHREFISWLELEEKWINIHFLLVTFLKFDS